MVFGNFRYRIFGELLMISTQDQARCLLVRNRQQQQNRRATMLGRLAKEVLPPDAQQ